MTARNERRRWVRASKVASRTRTKGGGQTAKAIRESLIRGLIAENVAEQRRNKAVFDDIARERGIE